MSYQISKYEAIKAVLRAEENHNDKLALKLMEVIRRATRREIKSSIYAKVYILNENEKKYFERVSVFLQSIDNGD